MTKRIFYRLQLCGNPPRPLQGHHEARKPAATLSPSKGWRSRADVSTGSTWRLFYEVVNGLITSKNSDSICRSGWETCAATTNRCFWVTAVKRKRISSNEAVQAMGNFLALGFELMEVEALRFTEMALNSGLTAYDAAYLALAEDEQCDLWTGDGAFYKAVKGSYPRVKWIGDIKGKREYKLEMKSLTRINTYLHCHSYPEERRAGKRQSGADGGN